MMPANKAVVIKILFMLINNYVTKYKINLFTNLKIITIKLNIYKKHSL